jgi:HEAT repeats
VTKRPAILLFILLLAGAALGFYYVIHPHEPTYKGRTARSWLIWCYYTHNWEDDTQVYEKTEAALRHLGTNAIPPLLQLLRAENNSTFRLRCRALWHKVSFVKGPLLAEEENDLARNGFLMLGDAATNAVTELIKICRQTNSTRLQYDAYEVLNTITSTPESTALLREALTNSHDTIRVLAYEYFTRTNQPERLQLLIEGLNDPSRRVQRFATFQLQSMKEVAKPAVPFLVPLAGVISNNYRSDAYSYNPAAAALHDIDPETAAKVLPPPFDWSSPPAFRGEVTNPREQKPASPSQ